jgi:uncharacterized SAM-binding protein YcdF (DUF218 family)
LRIFFSKIILPLPFFWVLILIGGLFFLFKRKKTGKICIVIALTELLLFSFPWGPDFLAGKLEDNYTPVLTETLQNTVNDSLVIWVLGGGHTNDYRLSATLQLSSRALGRLTEAIRLIQITGSNHLIVSGRSKTSQVTQAEVLRNAAVSLGVSPENITMVPEPTNTREEVRCAARILNPDQPFLLVTDAIHMPRAMQVFHREGLHPVAAPCNYMVKKEEDNPFLWWFPSSKNLEKAESAIHEYVGMVWYRVVEK